MSIYGSMLVASGAMAAYGDSLAVTGDNIANFNTVGYKESRYTFADLLSVLAGAVEIGQGVRLAGVSKSLQQGAFETTSKVTDLAISGNGFFVVRDPLSNTQYYTRAGQFHADSSGRLVNPGHMILQGQAGDIVIGAALGAPAQATGSLALRLNLDAAAAAPSEPYPAGPDAPASAWLAAGNFSTAVAIYDSDGKTHDLTFVYRRTAPDAWEYRVLAARNQLDGAAPNSTELRQVSAPGLLVFNNAGQLDSAASTITDIDGLNWISGPSQVIAAASLSFAGSVQFAQASSLLSAIQDGLPAGAFTGITVDNQGNIIGRYSNGTSRQLGAIVLAKFTNADDLEPVGDTLFLPTLASGPAQSGAANQNGLGGIVAGNLELSTVDLARQFIALLTLQRAFQVNSRVVTTADQMYATAAQLK